MIEPVPPTRQLVIDILEGLLSRRYSREEVVEWWHAVCRSFDSSTPGTLNAPLRNDEGYWEFVSFMLLLEPAPPNNPGNEGSYFIRDHDIAEWLAHITHTGAPFEDDIVRRHRWSAKKPSERPQVLQLPLIYLKDPGNTFFSSLRIKPLRGIVDDLHQPTEFASIEWREQELWIEKKDFPPTMMDCVCIHGVIDGAAWTVASLLAEIGIEPGQVDWVSEAMQDGGWVLRRIDTNHNEFIMREYTNYIEARLWQAHYERKGHRQTYLIDRKPESPAP